MLELSPIPRIVVASARGGSGKTSIALGLINAFARRGKQIQTFKVGPDFIDSAYLAHASGTPCRNLDAWMLGSANLRQSFARGISGADMAIIEGTVGLFDGHGSAQGEEHRFPGSTAQVAELIGAPVLLVIDVTAMGETAAAIACGMVQLAGNTDIAGVVLNNVESGERRRIIEDAIWNSAHLPVFGALPLLADGIIPEMRSGLLPVTQNAHVDAAITRLGKAVEHELDLNLIERVMGRARPVHSIITPRVEIHPEEPPVRVGVAYDEAFCFYYAENLEALEENGAEIVTFSPLDDNRIPDDIDFIYLGGGLSDSYISKLSANHTFIESMRRASSHGMPVYAECGGLVYCARSVRISDGSTLPMCALAPIDVGLEAGNWHNGYRDLTLAADSLLGTRGMQLRGHEFHLSRALPGSDTSSPVYEVHNCDGEPLGSDGYVGNNFAASFIHLHFGQDPNLAARFVQAARDYKLNRTRHYAGV